MANTAEYILIVDDDSDCNTLLKAIVSKTGIPCRVAETGAQALSYYHEKTPSLILMDYILPDQTGSDVLKKIREEDKGKDIPVISISADGMDPANGWTEIIRKPFSAQQVLEVISKYMNK